MTTACLPYPIGLEITVYKDDGQWDQSSKWFMRAMHQIVELFVAKITLRHIEGEDEPCYSDAEWAAKAAQLVETYPGCLFIYSTNEKD